MQAMYLELIEFIKTGPTEKQFSSKKRELCLKYGVAKPPTDFDIILHAPIEQVSLLKKKLLTKPVRTISGVSPIALMTRPSRCPHGKCTFCPGGIGSPYGDVPQSYTGKEPATMRGLRNHFDAYLMTFNRLEQYIVLGHVPEKNEVIVMGGTFPAEDFDYQTSFISDIFRAMNDFSKLFYTPDFDFKKFKEFFLLPGKVGSEERTRVIHKKLLELKKRNKKSLEELKNDNESSKIRCVALCIETKPDWCFEPHLNKMLGQGCTRVELGIQCLEDDILKKTHRGHNLVDIKKATRLLRESLVKVGYHVMPGLPGSTLEKDKAMLKELFSNPDYKPDAIKVYPCMVAPGTYLETLWRSKEFIPMDTETAAKLLAEFMVIVPPYCRVMRIQRDVPSKQWLAGVDLNNLRQYIDEKYKPVCRDIRAREPKNKVVDFSDVIIKELEYDCANSKEFFIQAVEQKTDILLGFCRLSFLENSFRFELDEDTAGIRELHVYGTSTKLGEEGSIQHRGLGKKLMVRAEELARQHNKRKIVVISGVGVKGYYNMLGYKKEGPYMSKNI